MLHIGPKPFPLFDFIAKDNQLDMDALVPSIEELRARAARGDGIPAEEVLAKMRAMIEGSATGGGKK